MSTTTHEVKAVFSAEDKSFTSTMKNLLHSTESLGSRLKTGLSFGVFSAIGTKAVNLVSSGFRVMTSHVDDAVERFDTLSSFPRVLTSIGFSAGDSSKAINMLATGIEGLPTTLDGIAGSAQQLIILNQNAEKGAKAAIALNDALVMSGAGAQDAARATQQFTQMLSTGKYDAQSFQSLVETMYPALLKTANAFGYKGPDAVSKLQAALKDGKISMKEFQDKLIELDEGTGGFAETARAASGGIQTAFTNLGTAVTKGLANILNAADEVIKKTTGKDIAQNLVALKGVINSVFGSIVTIVKSGLPKVIEYVKSVIPKIVKYMQAAKEQFKGVGTALKDAFSAVGKALKKTTAGFGKGDSLKSFSETVGKVADAIVRFAGFIERNADTIAKLIPLLPKVVAGFVGFRVLNSIIPITSLFSGALKLLGGALKNLGGKALSSITSKFGKHIEATSKMESVTETAGGKISSTSLDMAKSFALLGVAVLLIAAGFALLAQSAIALSNAGGAAIIVFFGMVTAVIALGAGFAILTKSMSTINPATLTSISVAFVAMGAAVLLVSAGFALLALSAISLSNAGTAAIAIFFGMVVAVAALAAIFAVLGPELTAGSVGFVALGAAILMVGAGIAIACAGIALLATQLPMIAAFGTQAAVGMLALGASLVVFGAGAIVAGAGLAVLAVGLVAFAVALVAAAVACGVLAVAVAALALGITAAAAGTLLLAASVLALGTALGLVGVTALAAATSVAMLSVGLMALTVAAVAGLASLVALEATLVLITATVALASAAVLLSVAAFAAFAGGAAVAAAALILVVAQLKIMQSSLTTIASKAAQANTSIASMKNGIDVVNSGLSALSSKIKTTLDNAISSFKSAASSIIAVCNAMSEGIVSAIANGMSKAASAVAAGANQIVSLLSAMVQAATAAGLAAGNGFSSSLASGLSNGASVARSIISAIVNTLNSGYNGAYNAGANIGLGLANGMTSQLSRIKSVASQMVAQANKAIEAKAKIGSPSKVTTWYGEMYGIGPVIGMKRMMPKVASAAEDLFEIPKAYSPEPANFRMTSAATLNDTYSYNSRSTIIVPLEIDGREFARATAPYNVAENNKAQARANRANGWR